MYNSDEDDDQIPNSYSQVGIIISPNYIMSLSTRQHLLRKIWVFDMSKMLRPKMGLKISAKISLLQTSQKVKVLELNTNINIHIPVILGYV